MATAATTARGCARSSDVVVIYEENHSFDNLYGRWEGVNGLAPGPTPRTQTQVSQDGTPYTLPAAGRHETSTSPPLAAPRATDETTTTPFDSHFTNNPFSIDDFIHPMGHHVPAAGGIPAQRLP